MVIPNTVSILGITYEVMTEEMEPGDDGYVSPGKQRIALSSALTDEKRDQVFLHELVHAILDQLSYSDLYEDECLVQGLAVGLHVALRDCKQGIAV